MKRHRLRIALRALCVWLCSLTMLPLPAAASAPTLDWRIELAAAHLLRMQLDSGFFVYEHDFLSGADSADNNIVRQAGAGFALGEYYRHAQDPAVARALARAIDAYGRSSVVWGNGLLLALDGRAFWTARKTSSCCDD